MGKKRQETPGSIQILRAAKASRKMTIKERVQLMLKAGLISKEQAEKAEHVEDAVKPKGQ